MQALTRVSPVQVWHVDRHRQRGPARDRTLFQPGRCVASAAAIPRNRPARLADPACIHCRQANLGASLSASTRITAHLGKHAETCASSACAGSAGRQRSRASPSSSELWTASAPTTRTGRAPVSSASTLSASVSAEMDRRDESRENSAHPSEMAAAHACRGRAQAL